MLSALSWTVTLPALPRSMTPGMVPVCIHYPQSSRIGLGNRGSIMDGAIGVRSATNTPITSTMNPFAGYMMTTSVNFLVAFQDIASSSSNISQTVIYV